MKGKLHPEGSLHPEGTLHLIEEDLEEDPAAQAAAFVAWLEGYLSKWARFEELHGV